MRSEFDKSFLRSIAKINQPEIQEKVKIIILEVENANKLQEIRNLKKLVSFKNFYRIKMGNYRIGFELRNNGIVRFILILHRKDFYKKFPL